MYFLVFTGNRVDISRCELNRSYYPIHSLYSRESTMKYVSRDSISVKTQPKPDRNDFDVKRYKWNTPQNVLSEKEKTSFVGEELAIENSRNFSQNLMKH